MRTEEQGQAPEGHRLSALDRAFASYDRDITEIILVRHAQQEHGTARGTHGNDPDLSALGAKQAQVVAEALARRPLDAVYTSTLVRASLTAQAIAASQDLAVEPLEGLREIQLSNRPDKQSGAPSRTERTSGNASEDTVERFIKELRWDCYPSSEGSAQFQGRVVSAIERIVVEHPSERVAIVSHGGVINIYLSWVLGLDTDMFFRPAHASISVLAAQGERRIVRSLNETYHLQMLDPALVTL